MLISLRNNIALLAMTKTGSTSVEAKLAPLCDIVFTHDPRAKHMQLQKFERFMRPYLKTLDCPSIETACLFRNPLDWLGSWYRYRQRDAIKGHKNSTAEMSFEHFVECYLSETPEPFAKVGRQSRFVLNKDGEVGIDHLFRYDRFDDFEVFLSERFGTSVSFDRLNSSPVLETPLPKALLLKLETELALDFEIFEGLRN